MVLKYSDFMQMVITNHPVSKAARLMVDRGAMAEQQARGNFDPKLFGVYDQKFFESKNYFALLNSGLKIPTWYGIEFKGGYETNNGVFLNDENTTPSSGLWYAGISIPVGQGLFIDERRAALRKAKLINQASLSQQILAQNELCYDAGKAYWDWFLAFNQQRIAIEAYNATNQRLQAVVESERAGDRSKVDTLEASIQMQERYVSMLQSRIELNNKTLWLSTFIWNDNDEPLQINDNLVAPDYAAAEQEFDKMLPPNLNDTGAINNHPLIYYYQVELRKLRIDQELKSEKLKPVVDLNYNLLQNNANINNLNTENYKWGVSVGFPIFIRKERAELKLAKIKVKEVELDLENKRVQLNNKLQMGVRELEIVTDQVNFYGKTLTDQMSLLNAERSLFDAGESNLFMINARESAYINASNKYVDLISKKYKAALFTAYSLGMISQMK
ncbi:MAG: TolC family protein [Bacteroidetes bacterium]|nr:TolC family protein [Bacteroidota bacterium]